MKYTKELLQLFSNRIPDGHHNIQFDKKLGFVLWLHIGEKFQSILFSDEDLDRTITPTELFDEIIIDLKNAGYNL